jgi:hypothetical protein
VIEAVFGLGLCAAFLTVVVILRLREEARQEARLAERQRLLRIAIEREVAERRIHNITREAVDDLLRASGPDLRRQL